MYGICRNYENKKYTNEYMCNTTYIDTVKYFRKLNDMQMSQNKCIQ